MDCEPIDVFKEMEKLLNNRSSCIHIRDLDGLTAKIEKFLNSGAQSVQVLADFDRTLTKHSDQGELCPSTHGILEDSHVFSESFNDATRRLRDKYYPLEMDPSIPPDQKENLMIEWWTTAHSLLLKEHLERDQIVEVVRRCHVKFRDDCEEVLTVFLDLGIPVLVFSAGMGTIVKEILHQKLHHVLKNTEIISNFMTFDSLGKHVGFQDPLIHTFNKGKICEIHKDYFDKHSERTNAILLGDTLGDLQMSNNLRDEKFNILKIGFLNDRVEQNLPYYMDGYDIVIQDPESMRFVYELMKVMFATALEELQLKGDGPTAAAADAHN